MSILSRSLIICVGLVAASAHAVTRAKSCGYQVIQGGFEIPTPSKLTPEERATLNALMFQAGHPMSWTPELERVVAEFLSDGRRGVVVPAEDFDELSELFRHDPNATRLIEILRRGQKFAYATDTLGGETQLTSARMVALKRHVLDALIAQSGVKMVWDVRLEQAATYVIETKERLTGADYDYLTRCLRNGGSNGKMIDLLMRVLRGPNL